MLHCGLLPTLPKKKKKKKLTFSSAGVGGNSEMRKGEGVKTQDLLCRKGKKSLGPLNRHQVRTKKQEFYRKIPVREN